MCNFILVRLQLLHLAAQNSTHSANFRHDNVRHVNDMSCHVNHNVNHNVSSVFLRKVADCRHCISLTFRRCSILKYLQEKGFKGEAVLVKTVE